MPLLLLQQEASVLTLAEALAQRPVDIRRAGRRLAMRGLVRWRHVGRPEETRLLSEQRSPERAIPSAAVTLSATLVVVGSASDEAARRMTAQIAASLACSVLAVPSPGPNRARGAA